MSDKIDSARVSGLPGADVVKATLNNLSEQVSQAGATVASAAVAVADDAQSRVASLADEAKDRVASATDSFKSEFASGIDAVGQAMHRAGSVHYLPPSHATGRTDQIFLAEKTSQPQAKWPVFLLQRSSAN